jgi:hypothetical protein
MRRILVLIGVAAVVAAGAMTVPAVAGAATTTCTSTLAPGTYGTVVVPAGAVCIIDHGPLTITGGLVVGAGATFVFGSEETPDVTATIYEGVHATNAASVQIHFATIYEGVFITGGAGPFGGPFDVTWTTIEDSLINGPVTIQGYNGFWAGFIRNTVFGTVTYRNNTVADPDGNEVVTNTIHGNLVCSGNTPPPQVGDSEGSPNTVTGRRSGQCALL